MSLNKEGSQFFLFKQLFLFTHALGGLHIYTFLDYLGLPTVITHLQKTWVKKISGENIKYTKCISKKGVGIVNWPQIY